MIDNNEVKEVSYDEYSGQFVFIAGEENAEQIYKTGIWPEDGQRLLQQLMEHEDIKFSATIPTQANPLLSFILTWILPILFFFIIGEIFYRWMAKKMKNQMPGGMGNAMSFGKSGAKIYVAGAKTGVKFKDVAGQDEAKESLIEVVDYLHDPKKYASIGAQRKNAVISDREKKIVAYHEIGHALVAAKQSNSAPVTKITIVPRTSGALGYCSFPAGKVFGGRV